MKTGLLLKDVSFSYGSGRALDEVGFETAKGQFTALLGPNGAGKSTLFALLTRLLVTRQGHLSVAGHDLAKSPHLALNQIGIVFQHPTLELDLSVRRNLTYAAALRGLSGKTAGIKIDAALDRLNLSGRATEKVRALNGGHRRRMEIARALIHDPSVLLLDEPTVGLDAASRLSITNHVHDLASDGVSVLWATHLVDEIRDQDQVVVLHHGRIIADGLKSDITQGRDLAQVFTELTEGSIA
jgi:ABC-2 type transport system ATP-binding protein